MQSQNGQPSRTAERIGIVSVSVVLTAAVTALTMSAVGGAAASGQKPTEPAKPTEQEVAALFDGWNAALQTGDAEAVADRYAPDAVLLPTASARIRTDRDGIVDYFEHFQEGDPVGEITESVVTVLDEDSAIDAGTYVFTLTDAETGEVRNVEARYSYAYEKIDGEWLIVNHHSSATPAEG